MKNMMRVDRQRELARQRLDKEFANAINLIETALSQVKFHYEAFREGDDSEKADRASSAVSWIRRMTASVETTALADLAARLDVLASIKED